MSAGSLAAVWGKKAVKLGLLAPGLVAREREPGLFVLVYHRVGAGMQREMDLPPRLFRRQMRYVGERFEVVALEDGVGRLAAGPPAHDLVAVTFDDGYRDVWTAAWPVLEQLGIPATLFLASGFLEGKWPAPVRPGAASRGSAPRPLRWDDVEEMISSGLVSIGSHSHSHREFDRLTPDEANEECARSRLILEERLRCPVETFAYPRGFVSHEAVVASHYRYAFGADGAKTFGPIDAPHRLARMPVRASDGMFFFGRRLAGVPPLEDRLYDRVRAVTGS